MRPLMLTIEGLRSFRSPVQISFEGRDHLAVIGDTGAGKSSILEAMTYALFGRTTFTGHANQEIINDLAEHMRVTLRFTVVGRTYEVTRTLRRAGDRTVGSAKASLTELASDGTEVHKTEQVRQVNNAIQKALGLDAEAFLRTVILPQGQFAQLLVGDDPAARAAILRQVWRTDELSRAGQLAEETLPELGHLVGQIRQALAGNPDDPATHLQHLRAEADRRVEATDRARETHRVATAARDALDQANEITQSAESVLARIGGFDFGEVTTAAEEVVRSADTITTARRTAGEQQSTLRQQLRSVPSDSDGLDHQEIGAARTILDSLPTRAATAASAAAKARAEADDADAAKQLVTELAKRLQDLDQQLDQRANVRQDLDVKLAEADTKLDGARSLFDEVQQAALEAERLQAQANDVAHQAEHFSQQAAQLQVRDLSEANRRAKALEEAYHTAQRHNAAAAAVHDLHPGDECTICKRPLPRDWQRPVAADLDAARDAHKAAQAKLTSVLNEIDKLTTRAEVTNTQAAELRERAEQLWQVAREATGRLAPLLGRDDIDIATLLLAAEERSGVDVRDELLQSLSDAVAKAREELVAYEAELQLVREKRAAAEASLTNARAGLDKTRATHRRDLEELEAAVQAFRSDLAWLPDQLRIDVTLPEDLHDIDVLRLEGLDAAYQVLDDRAEELNRRAKDRKELQEELDRIAKSTRDLDQRWVEQVHAPGNRLVGAVNGHRDVLSDGIRQLSIGDVTLRPAASLDNPAELAEMVRAFRETTEAVSQRARERMEGARTRADEARQTIARLAADLGMPESGPRPPSADSVVAHTGDKAAEADLDARGAERAAESFARLVDPLTRLRSIDAELNLTYDVLRDLSAALKPGAFPKWLTLRRSRALLIHASRLLEQMSGGRYAFAELTDENAEWRVVDNDSGLARSPASLSGGEKFIASLALALGMVEMMARSGGRLESLWLDEGFGSLDRSNLDAAIDALTSVAAQGRMVAVISHVRAVAEQVSHVLSVTHEVTGTQVDWLDSAQRAQLATSDLDSETAGALSGLID